MTLSEGDATCVGGTLGIRASPRIVGGTDGE
jgi:hypothetical protein